MVKEHYNYMAKEDCSRSEITLTVAQKVKTYFRANKNLRSEKL